MMTTQDTLEMRVRATLAHVADATSVPPLPSLDVVGGQHPRAALARRSPRRRTALAGIAALAMLGGGLSVAAAAGVPVLPGPVVRALGWEAAPGAYNADPATARLLLSIPGPAGVPLTLWYSDANDHGYCVSLTSAVVADPSAPPGYSAVTGGPPSPGTGANGCSGPVGDHSWHQFGGAAFSSANRQFGMFIVHVPGAASVRLHFTDSTSHALPVADNWTAGWMTREQAAKHPVLVGYATDGTEVARFDLAHFTAIPR